MRSIGRRGVLLGGLAGAGAGAGEHTARYSNRSTMNGAAWSGERAARMVERFLARG